MRRKAIAIFLTCVIMWPVAATLGITTALAADNTGAILFDKSYGLFNQWRVMFRDDEWDSYWGYHSNLTLTYWGLERANFHIVDRTREVADSVQSWRVINTDTALKSTEQSMETFVTDSQWSPSYTVWDEVEDWCQTSSDAALYAAQDLGLILDGYVGTAAEIAQDLAANQAVLMCLVALLAL